MKCARCGGSGFYTRQYSGETLCKSCFTQSIVEKARRTISRYRMIRPGEKVAVAVSGGKDSLSLLKVLTELYAGRRNPLVAISIDEGVAGYRDEAIEHAGRLTRELGVQHVTLSYKELFGFSLDEALDWKEERDVSSCSFCGVFRRRAIDEAASRVQASLVATAHNLDDYVQTFMLNLMHGDVARLGWLDPAYADDSFPVRRVKPFMEIYEAEVALFAYQTGVPFQSVSCPYMHEGLRSEVRDYLNLLESNHPGIKNVMFRSSLDVVSHYARAPEKGTVPCSRCGKPSSAGLCSVCRMKVAVEEHTRLL
ncbi:MAG: TIGR00269 family protein [Nitrososphaerota archaeon]|nr:TIGR00269 family protein [Nitrososphaerota archaeon]MDG6975405.1 TIGR00269 family protein [Nitrososphaerota archaeon]MDG7009927.1 TIGR00269 family protein [Nitrososphaerota archaeon]MDG7027252.1 TIGR00269 family protein [Nitrososphaerota archaeon]MDG7030413.1 TIGR00269 family protein [Nitrososphaerota archaeon]